MCRIYGRATVPRRQRPSVLSVPRGSTPSGTTNDGRLGIATSGTDTTVFISEYLGDVDFWINNLREFCSGHFVSKRRARLCRKGPQTRVFLYPPYFTASEVDVFRGRRGTAGST